MLDGFSIVTSVLGAVANVVCVLTTLHRLRTVPDPEVAIPTSITI